MGDFEIDERVDITDVVCPMTFVKAKVAMEELEIGQAASMIKHLQPVSEVMKELVEDYNTALRRIQDELNWN